jgi:hypothetical protein
MQTAGTGGLPQLYISTQQQLRNCTPDCKWKSIIGFKYYCS